MIIKGKYNRAVVYTDVIEDGAVDQIKELCDAEPFKDAKIRIMPDVHQGKGCVIGFTADLQDKVIPNIVGVDIGCGMLTVMLGQADIDFKKLDEFIYQKIPHGRKIYEHKMIDFMDELASLSMLKDARDSLKKWNRAIGTLGGGNHFIEINVDEKDNKYLVIHSGSRNLGHAVATHYQHKAIGYHSGYGEEFLAKRAEIIETFVQQGRRKEIQTELETLKGKYRAELTLPRDLCYLQGDMRDAYLHDMAICQRFANLNREVMAKSITEHLYGHSDFEAFQTVHNYIDFEDNIVRKGAIKAAQNQQVLIPINMRDGSIFAVGKGNADWNCSAPHGAGRLMSRTKAFELLAFDEFEKEMQGIYTTSVTPKTIDESPMAYKSIDDIISNIEETVEIKAILKPVYNFKSQN